MDQGLKGAREGAHSQGDNLPGGVEVGEWPAGFRGRDAVRTDRQGMQPRLRGLPMHGQHIYTQ